MDEQMQEPGIMEKIVNALRSVGAAGMGAPASGSKPLRQWQEEFATDSRGHPTLDSFIAAGGAPYAG